MENIGVGGWIPVLPTRGGHYYSK